MLCRYASHNKQHATALVESIQTLIQNMPQLICACEHEWQAKLSFFMIFQAMISFESPGKDNHLRHQLFDMFGRDMLIESLLRVEDSVRIAITDLLSSYLPEYFAAEKSNYIDRILLNLAETLKKTDDIESSVIFAFNLFNEIVHAKEFDEKKTKFKFELGVFCPFNFHRLVPVRLTYNNLVGRFLKMQDFFSQSDLFTLHTLTVQALIMEEDTQLTSVLKTNLQ